MNQHELSYWPLNGSDVDGSNAALIAKQCQMRRERLPDQRNLLAPIGYIPPAEAEANYWRYLVKKMSLPFQLKPTGLHETPGDSGRGKT
jgi:hypothetical protein